jgi:hypothetical protein
VSTQLQLTNIPYHIVSYHINAYLVETLEVRKIGDGKWRGHVAHLGEKRSNTVVVKKSSGRATFGRPEPKWDDNIKLEPKEI